MLYSFNPMVNDILGNDITIRMRKKPYRHIVIDNLFKKDFYQTLCEEFQSRLEMGFAEKFSRKKFWKFSHYDAYCWSFDPEKDHKFSDVFYSPAWRRFINNFFGLKLTKNVLAEFHHHMPNSAKGYIHNDYDISSFIKEPLPNGMNPHRHKVKYRGRVDGAIHCVRSIAVLYYFNNPKWNEGDGGESAMFTGYGKDEEPVRKVAPVNNRLFAFEISPTSFHSFISNKRNVRNSMVMWFHSPEPYCVARYGEAPK